MFSPKEAPSEIIADQKNPLRLQSSTATIFVGKTNTEIAGWEINNTAKAVGGQILHQLVREE